MNLKAKWIALSASALVFFTMVPAMAQTVVDTGNFNRTAPQNYLGVGSNETYQISFRQASLRESLQFLAWISGINIMIPEATEGVVNVNFKDVTAGDAINAIAKTNQLEYTVEGRVIRIGKSEQFKDAGEDLKTETFRLQYAPSKEMEGKVKTLLSSRGSVIHDERTNSIVVRELPSNLENVQRFIDSVDIKDAQVLIESKILEATRTFSRDLGIQWDATKGADGSKFRMAGVKSVGQADSGRNLNVNLAPAAPTSGILLGALFKGLNIEAQILAAEKSGDAYVISDPSVVTSNGRAANIRSGATLLIQGSSTVNIGTATGGQQTSNTSMGNGLQQIETGVELTVTPQITVNDFVKLDIEATTSTPDFSRAVQGIPIIVDNTAKTTVLVKDGETTVIGGLTRYSDSLTKKKVPYFGDIPLVGNLFKSKSRSRENTELMIFIKPTVIRVDGIAPAQVRVREVEERRAAMYVEPNLDPKKDAANAAKKEKVIHSRKGNKYSR